MLIFRSELMTEIVYSLLFAFTYLTVQSILSICEILNLILFKKKIEKYCVILTFNFKIF